MKTLEFQDFLLKSATMIIGCDGDIDDSEIVEINKLIDDEVYFLGFVKENKLDVLISEFKEKGKDAINSYLKEFAVIDLLHRQKLILLEVLIIATEADGVIHPNEVKLLHLILPKLSLDNETIIINFPNQIGYLLNFKNNDLNKEFTDEIEFTSQN